MSSCLSPLAPAIVERIRQLELGEPRLYKGIGLWPVWAAEWAEPTCITLAEALDLPGFRITEVNENGSVPDLRVINETPRAVLLFDGEELKGAKQNRILNNTVLVPEGSSLAVSVSCSESGRWSYESPQFSSSGLMAHAKLREVKAAAVSRSLRQGGGHAADQGEVWDEIEALHLKADSDGTAPTRALKDAYERRRSELDGFALEVPCLEGQCGLVAVVGERVEGVDVLSRPAAYARLHRRLVESHAMDFLVRRSGEIRRPVDPEAPARFLGEAARAEESMHASPGLGSDHRLRFRRGHGSALKVGHTVVHLALFGGGTGRLDVPR